MTSCELLTFEMHPSLLKKSLICQWPLCSVLMEDDQHYPWIILVPRRLGACRIMDLAPSDQLQLLQELDRAQRIMWEAFTPTQLNVAALGNKTPQLHIHVIARFTDDPTWPGTVWDHKRVPCENNVRELRLKQIKELLG